MELVPEPSVLTNQLQASKYHADIPLNLTDIAQAHQVTRSLNHASTLTVASSLSRAQSTAMVTVAKFAAIPLETWPIHEFTYLEPARCANTTVAQRRAWVE